MRKKIILALLSVTIRVVLIAQVPVQPINSNRVSIPSKAVTAILGAFPAEVEILHAQIEQKKETVIQNVRFTEGILNGRKVVLAQTGIGKVNAASTTTLMLEHFNPEQVLFTGIAGGINPALAPGDIVVGVGVTYHDYGSITPDSMLRRATRNPFTMQENPLYFIPDTNLVKIADVASKRVVLEKVRSTKPKIIKGIIVTGDVFVASSKATEELLRHMHADATEMEGAAVAQICWQQQVPLLVIRSLSDNANNNASTDVQTFYQVAARNSAALIVAIAGLIKGF